MTPATPYVKTCTPRDIGIIHLASPLGKNAGYLDYVSLPDEILTEKILCVAGYPADVIIDGKKENNRGQYMYAMHGRTKSLTSEQIFYDNIHTFPGHSGSGIQCGGKVILGVHTNGLPPPMHTNNRGKRLNDGTVEWIKSWIKEKEAK